MSLTKLLYTTNTDINPLLKDVKC